MAYYPKTFSGRRASQSDFELSSLIQLLKDKGVKRYLEVGARDGDTFHEIMSNLPTGSLGVALDLPGGLWGRTTSQIKLVLACENLNTLGYSVKCVFGDSSDKSVVDKIQNMAPFDAILIDGDHTYEGVKTDYENYKDLAPIIIFHDIVGTGNVENIHNRKVEVPVLWNEIKDETSIEYIDPECTMGIGIKFI